MHGRFSDAKRSICYLSAAAAAFPFVAPGIFSSVRCHLFFPDAGWWRGGGKGARCRRATGLGRAVLGKSRSGGPVHVLDVWRCAPRRSPATHRWLDPPWLQLHASIFLPLSSFQPAAAPTRVSAAASSQYPSDGDGSGRLPGQVWALSATRQSMLRRPITGRPSTARSADGSAPFYFFSFFFTLIFFRNFFSP